MRDGQYFKLRNILLVSIMVASTSNASNFRPWLSFSTLWGQGGTGIVHEDVEFRKSLTYEFVWDWEEEEFTYHQITSAIDYRAHTVGFKYRYQLSKSEYAPYVGYFIPIECEFPISIYNEAEYRINSVVKDTDYLRTRHIFSVYAPREFKEKYILWPYIALDTFIDWQEFEIEKIRLNMGYFMTINRIRARVYIIPWSGGIKEEEWDDNSKIGATATYNW